jgi:hypothetical protein
MTQIIKPDTVDFNILIKNNTVLTLNGQSKMIEILTKEFTEEESKWYIANLYIYMNYHPTNDFPINLETLVNLVGFAHKKNAKTTLENNFIKDEDYKIVLTPKGKQKNTKETRGGQVPKRTCKKVCQYNANTNELINSWDSLSIASRELGIATSSLSNYCRFNNVINNIVYKYLEQ